MRGAVDTEAVEAGATAGSVAVDTRVSVVAPVRAELVAATVELESADQPAHMRRGLIHLESQADDMAGTGKGTTRREPRLEDRFMVQLRDREPGPLPDSLLVRRITPVATMFRKIDPELALPGNPTSSPDTIREQIAISASNAPERLPEV
jgi:hypothetical protein